MFIKGEDENSYITIHVDKEDEMGVRFTVETQCRGFSATFGGIYIISNDITDFVRAFQSLESKRRGEARLQSASPDEFDLAVRIIDRAGHVLVSLRVQDLSYYDTLVIPCSLEVTFGIYPTTLPTILNEFKQLEKELR